MKAKSIIYLHKSVDDKIYIVILIQRRRFNEKSEPDDIKYDSIRTNYLLYIFCCSRKFC